MKNKKRCAIVTGGTRGIGLAITKRFIKEGIRVILIGKNRERVASVTESLGEDCQGYQIDLSILESIENELPKILQENGSIDILVNNAGICTYSDFFDVTNEQFFKTINTNLSGHYFLTQHISKQMIDLKVKGSIINMGSLNSFLGGEIQTDYSISKAGINLFTKSLCSAFGKYGIRVNTVCPGIVITDINKKRYSDKNLVKNRLSRIPLKRFGDPDEIAAVVSFLVSEGASYINGQAIIVDGGWSAAYS